MDRRVKERLVGATILVVLVVLIVPELLSGPKRAGVPPHAALPAAIEPVRSVTVDLATNQATAAAEEAAAASVGGGGDAPATAVPGSATAGGAAPGTAPAGTAPGTVAPGGAGGPGDGASDSGSSAAGGVEPGRTGPDESAPAPALPEPSAAAPAPAAHRAATPLESAAASPRSAQSGATTDSTHHGWAAQLGSFAARGNAEKLERQLRLQGFSPFLSSTGSGRGLRYRVRVGPVADRAAAERLSARLQKAGHAARVVPP